MTPLIAIFAILLVALIGMFLMAGITKSAAAGSDHGPGGTPSA